MEFKSKRQEKPFLDYVSNAITRSCTMAINNSKSYLPHEPDFVAYIIKNLPLDLYNALKANSSYQFDVAGVYCHQKPLVDYGMKPCPELGDLLLVYIEENPSGEKRCNSLLLQAKRTISNSFPIQDKHQLKLYKEWPKFRYKRAGKLNGIERDIIPKTINSGAQYLMMVGACDKDKLFGCAVPNDTIEFGRKLSENILNLLTFTSGRTFDYNHPVADDWTNMIWDLIDIAKKAKFKRNNSGIAGEDRLFLERHSDLSFDDTMDFFIDDEQNIYDISMIPILVIKSKLDNNNME